VGVDVYVLCDAWLPWCFTNQLLGLLNCHECVAEEMLDLIFEEVEREGPVMAVDFRVSSSKHFLRVIKGHSLA